ncbi:MAG: hypothetical protein F9K28_10830 [Bacteroidetes bacterium]|nr:MAG: hypothetical protein F9K28_10830 [Bacteroidota bacterium]
MDCRNSRSSHSLQWGSVSGASGLGYLCTKKKEHLYPKWIAWVGLATCLFPAFWVEVQIWLAGLGMSAFGLIWHVAAQWLTGRSQKLAGS